jgi:hypothetical protein
MKVVTATWKGDVEPVWDKFKMEGDMLVSYALKSATSGGFTETGVQTRVANKLANALEARKSGRWEIRFDEKNDLVEVTQNSSLPNMVTPPNWPVVATEEEARARYPEFSYSVGSGREGKIIQFKPSKYAHMGIYGGTGGGKSVTTRAIIEQFRAAGFQLFICDGKQTDYTGMKGQNGVVAIGSSIREQIAVVHMVRRIMNHRRRTGEQKGNAGVTDWREHQTPLLLVLDEFATTSNDIQTLFPKTSKLFLDDIEAILKVGREFRCHIIIATQDMRAKTLRGDWLNNILVNICMGPPKDQIIPKGFPPAVQAKAQLVGDQISPNTKGRGIVSLADDKSGIADVEMFQSFFSYSPGEHVEMQSGPVRSDWMEFKEKVSDRVPPLYSRMWIIPEYPEPEDGEKDLYADQRKRSKETGLVNLDDLDVPDIHRLRNVALEDKNGPITANAKYDPGSSSYIAQEDLGDAEALDISL